MRATVRGRLVDEQGRPHAGLVVAVERRHVETRLRLAQVTTEEDGSFDLELEFPDEPHLVVYDALGLRPLHKAPLTERARAALVDEPLLVPRHIAHGWTVTSGDTPDPLRATDGNDVELFTDDESFARIEGAIRGARRSIHLMQLLFGREFSASRRLTRRPPLLEVLADSARRGVQVRILVNDNAVVPDSVEDLQEFAQRAAPTFRVRGFPITPNVLHAKLLVVDDAEAYVIGPPFEQKYWDTSVHARRDPRRGAEAEREPVHDVTARVRGPAVAHLHAAFARLWNTRGRMEEEAEDRLAPIAPPPPAGASRLQVVHTVPPNLLADTPGGETSILEAYLRAIASARDFVYLENQYFTSPTVAEALTRALRRSDELQVIAVLNERTDVPTYIHWQKRRLSEMGYPRAERLGVFVLRAPRSVYVHSKLAIADDAWATTGTANLDSISLETAQEFAAPVDPDVETNIVVLDGVDGAPATGRVAQFRRRLWREHLGEIPEVWGPRPEGGWLALWRRIATANADRVREGKTLQGNVVPYLPQTMLAD